MFFKIINKNDSAEIESIKSGIKGPGIKKKIINGIINDEIDLLFIVIYSLIFIFFLPISKIFLILNKFSHLKYSLKDI